MIQEFRDLGIEILIFFNSSIPQFAIPKSLQD